MKAIFYTLAVVATGAAGYSGWQVKEKYATQIEERDVLLTKNENLSKNINDEESKKSSAEDALSVAKTEQAEAEQGLKAAKAKYGEFERTLEEISGLLEEANGQEAEVTGVVESLKSLFPDVELEAVPKIYDDLVAQEKKLTADFESEETVKKRLEEDVAKNLAEIVRLEEKITESKNRVASNTFQATVTGVDPDWDYVVIGAGSQAGLDSDSRLLVQRDGRLLGKLSVTKIEGNRTLADIVPGSMRPGVVLQRGDQVILETTRSN